MPTCCGRAFWDNQALRQHQDAKHPLQICQKCNRSFRTLIGLEDHNRDRHKSPPRKVKSSPVSSQTNQSNRDRYCGECQRLFVDATALTQHLMSAIHGGGFRWPAIHASEFRCCDCERNFHDTSALMQHLKDKVHKPKPAPAPQSETKTCQKCSRQFGTKEALLQHQSSRIHRARSIACAASGVGSGGCGGQFGSPAAMLQHLESGACPSGMDRQKLNLLVLRSDHEGLISNPAGGRVHGLALLQEATRRLGKEATAWGDGLSAMDSRDSSGSSTGDIILTPSSTGIISPSSLASPILTSASDYNSALAVSTTKGGTRCPLCPPTRRPFPTPQSLQQHMESPAHDAQIFRCPVSNRLEEKSEATVKWFSTVSGMGQHVESGACPTGGSGFGTVLRNLETEARELGLPLRLAISQ
ncbi:hypothetical protein QBC47DRAFT_457211 [Echria macrotheca]|uniref:C2H2-type domain-containing protein n=1 Tax=Echria macrotheca TaxID=438768 RepID=A0AAJ0F879_9PEZI|nr:hypothetical protein QBC47DRAFT_457211 [Echria macrotheca]